MIRLSGRARFCAAAGVVAMMGLAGTSGAAILIDNFHTPMSVSLPAGGTNATATNTGANSIGGTRDLKIQRFTGSSAASADVDAGSNGLVQVHSGAGNMVQFWLTWDGNTNVTSQNFTGLGSIDLTE